MVNIRKETQEETIKRLSDPNYEGGNYALPENASELEKSKYEICQNIARYKRINEVSLKNLAYELGISLKNWMIYLFIWRLTRSPKKKP